MMILKKWWRDYCNHGTNVMVVRLIVDLLSKSFLIVNYLYVILCYYVLPMLEGYMFVRVHVELRD